MPDFSFSAISSVSGFMRYAFSRPSASAFCPTIGILLCCGFRFGDTLAHASLAGAATGIRSGNPILRDRVLRRGGAGIDLQSRFPRRSDLTARSFSRFLPASP